MKMFMAIFIGTYGVLNAYVVSLLYRAFGWKRGAVVLCGVWVILMMAAPIAGRMLDRAGAVRASMTVQLVGYVWMLALMWLVCFGGLAEVYNAGIGLLSLVVRRAAEWRVPLRGVVAAVAVGGVLMSAWGLREAVRVRLREVTVRTPRFPAGAAPVRVVHISDLHLGCFVGHHRARRAAELVERVRPDLILAGGDMLDSSSGHIDGALDTLAGLVAGLGKYAVLGNHECYVGVSAAVEKLARAGFRVLRQESVTLSSGGATMLLAGVDDPAAGRLGGEAMTDEGAVLPAGDDRPFTLLLKHQPRVAAGIASRFDLQVSGHTHGGQIFPFQLFVRLAYPRIAGGQALGKGSALYISRGCGTWGPPIRVLAPPEVTLFVIAHGAELGMDATGAPNSRPTTH